MTGPAGIHIPQSTDFAAMCACPLTAVPIVLLVLRPRFFYSFLMLAAAVSYSVLR